MVIHLSERADARLGTIARRRRVSKSRLVREFVESQFGDANKADGKSAFDLVKRLVGTLKGPSDLSTNPKHMQGFGG